jgi:hypothetical protein
MKTQIRTLLLGAALATLAGPAAAACYADYRAKMDDDPMRLHYGVIELPDWACSVEDARSIIAARIATGGWELLEVISVFDESGLDGRRTDAGSYFLRF